MGRSDDWREGRRNQGQVNPLALEFGKLDLLDVLPHDGRDLKILGGGWNEVTRAPHDPE
jgi:hypothetical protein